MELILASQSPRRQELLGKMGPKFTVRPADIDETMDPADTPAHQVGLVSRRKATAAVAGPEDVVIAADTIVVVGDTILGKPHSPAEAAQMLERLSGRDHQVMTGCTVRRGDRMETFTEVTHMIFRPLSREEIDYYVSTGEPMDKAGAYGIQGGACLFVQRLEGDYYNVMGLPVCRLAQVLRTFGVPVFGTL